ncbi:hypothetical protein [Enterococcus gallinarum]|uniref:hypothetical protein n=1 Tax=Enterococcus gallinarum TaxID=1353 RepID=UPI0030C17B92
MAIVEDQISFARVEDGEDGRGIKGTPVSTYAQSTSGTTPPTTWSDTRPNVPAGQYLWTRVVTTYTDDTTSETQTPTLMGKEGTPGLGIKSKSISYAIGTSGNTPPTSGWQESIPNVSANQYLWTKTTLVYTDDSKTESYSVGKMGANGADAKLLYLTASAENMVFNADDTPKTTQTINITAKLQNVTGTATFAAIPYIGNTAQAAITLGGSGNTRTLTSAQWTNKNWTLIAITATLDNLSDTLSIVKVKDGKEGEDGQDAHIYQAYSWSPDGADRFTIPYPNENLIVHSTEIKNTNIHTTGAPYPDPNSNLMGDYISVKPGDVLYFTQTEDPSATYCFRWRWADKDKNYIERKAESGKKSFSWTVPTGAYYFQASYPNVGDNKIEFSTSPTIYTPAPSDDFINAYPSYVGTYTTFDDVQSTNPADYTWQRILGMNGENGKDGIAGKDGVGVSDTNITYAQSTSGTSAPTSGWTIQVPALIKGQYLWTKTTWTYTDSSTETGYTVSYNAKDGNNGTDGIAGKDGVGISSTKIEYVSSTSGTVKPTTGWTTSIPTVPAGSFLWTKTTWTYTDGTNESGYSAAKMGEKGDQGIQGPKGSDGQTYYTWLKYADTPTSGMSDSPTGKTYIGLAYNKASATESTNYADYTWSLIKGSDGAQGPKGDNGQTLYTWIKYATSATGAGMSDSPTGKTYIGLAYNKTTANESTNAADYSWSLIKGDKGDTGPTGPQGPQGPAGPKGDRGIMGVAYMQPTQPSDTTEGATWFQTESSTSDKIIAVYTYKSGWQKKKYASATLAVESLDALSADLGKITAGIINGVEIQGDGLYSDYDYQIAEGSTVWRKGRLSMSGGYFRNDFQTYVKSTGEIQNNGFSQFSHEDLQFVVFNGSQKTKADRYLSINPYRFTMTDSRGLGGNLTFQDLYNIGKTGIPAASGWSQYSTSPSSGNFPSATRLGRMVQVSGAFKNNSTLPNTNDTYVVGVLPVGFRPQMQVKYLGKGAGTTIFMVTIDTNGEISISYRLGWTGSSFGYLTNNANDIFNIAGVFSAADV